MTPTKGQVADGTRGPSDAVKKMGLDTTLAVVSSDVQLTGLLQRISTEMHAPMSRFDDPVTARAELDAVPLEFGT